MRQGYIDSQGNKYILTGVKAQFPRWTYAEWQAEGEPDIPWIRTDAPSGYRKVSANDTSYDNTTSGLTATEVNGAIDEVSGNVSNKEDKIASVSVTFRYANYGLWVKTNLASSFQIIGVNTTDYMVLDGGGTSYVRIYSVGSQSITPAPTTSAITISCVVAKR